MFLITYPNYALKTKRFSGLIVENLPDVQPPIKIACKIYTVIHLLTVIVGVAFFIFLVMV